MVVHPLYNITVGAAPAPFLWFRVAKAGTQSTFAALRAVGLDFEIENGFGMRVPPHAWTDHLRFTFVRDPYARIVSAWRDKIILRRKGSGINDQVLYEQLSDFDCFIDWVRSQAPDQINVHFRPQVMLVPDEIDFIGRLESFDADLRYLFERLGLGDLREVPHINFSNRAKRPEPTMSPSALQGINAYFRDDFRRFGYAIRT